MKKKGIKIIIKLNRKSHREANYVQVDGSSQRKMRIGKRKKKEGGRGGGDAVLQKN